MKPLTKCPICGSRKIERIKKSVELHPNGRKMIVPNLPVDHCTNCGETFFDHDASSRIDAAMPTTRRHSARRKSA